MAITKILNIKESEGRNPASHLKNALEYIQNPDKTEECVLVGGINCLPDTAFEQMEETKNIFHKTGKRQGYHVIISFSLEGKLNSVNNYCIAVKEKGDDIVFLRKIVKGGADKSYGIQVAKLAGVPDNVIERAKEIVEELSNNDITEIVQNISAEGSSKRSKPKLDEVDLEQISLLDTMDNDTILNELKELDLGQMTPIEAMNKLYELQNKVKNRW